MDRDALILVSCYSGLGIKAVNALVEFTGGLLMVVRNHDWLNRLIRLIAIPELGEDPNDFLMNHLILLEYNRMQAEMERKGYGYEN